MLNIKLKSIDAFFFDFDGVIIESTEIKTDAFYEVYLPFGNEVASFSRDYHLHNQGINRHLKFEKVKEKFNLDIDNDKLSEIYSECVFDKILSVPLVEGVISFLETLISMDRLCFLISATPHQELIDIVEKRLLSHYFNQVIGAPKSKVESGADLLSRFSLKAAKCLLIGDSKSDLESAIALNMPFLGRIVPNKIEDFGDNPTINNFTEIQCK
jgi:beta-phosphoglucomutase-like phosphatase (HAD superfamily)